MNFVNKTIIITGATGGLGQAVVDHFAQQGANIAAIARNRNKLEELQHSVEKLPGKIGIYLADVTSPNEVKTTLAVIHQKFGSIDALIHLAGGFAGGKSIAETLDKMWDDMLELNLTAAFYCCREAMSYMSQQKAGKIVTISALAALQHKANRAAYTVAKAGIIALTRSLAEEGKAVNVQANCIAPGIILTAANKSAMPEADTSHWITPPQIAKTIAFLCSPQADAISGSVIEMP